MNLDAFGQLLALFWLTGISVYGYWRFSEQDKEFAREDKEMAKTK